MCGERVIGFYGHQSSKKWCEFSNFYNVSPYDFHLPAFAVKEGLPRTVTCQFSEKAIMVTKAAMMSDFESFNKMLAAETPGDVKALGRQVTNFDNDLWSKHLDEVAYEVVRQKFASDPALAALLLSTGESILAEATSKDKIWGIGLDVGDPRVQDLALWNGRNVLGTALMRARSHLGAAAAAAAPAGSAGAADEGELS